MGPSSILSAECQTLAFLLVNYFAALPWLYNMITFSFIYYKITTTMYKSLKKKQLVRIVNTLCKIQNAMRDRIVLQDIYHQYNYRAYLSKSDLIAWKMKTRANQPCWIIRLAQFISLESWKCLFFFSVWYYDCWNQKLEIKTKSFPSKEKLCDYFIFFLNLWNY